MQISRGHSSCFLNAHCMEGGVEWEVLLPLTVGRAFFRSFSAVLFFN